jgi:hypothetical protein
MLDESTELEWMGGVGITQFPRRCDGGENTRTLIRHTDASILCWGEGELDVNPVQMRLVREELTHCASGVPGRQSRLARDEILLSRGIRAAIRSDGNKLYLCHLASAFNFSHGVESDPDIATLDWDLGCCAPSNGHDGLFISFCVVNGRTVGSYHFSIRRMNDKIGIRSRKGFLEQLARTAGSPRISLILSDRIAVARKWALWDSLFHEQPQGYRLAVVTSPISLSDNLLIKCPAVWNLTLWTSIILKHFPTALPDSSF